MTLTPCRSGAAGSVVLKGRQAQRGGDGPQVDPLEASAARSTLGAKASAMKGPRDETPTAARCTARQRGPAEPETHGIVNPHRCLCCNPWTRHPAFSHRRKVADQHRLEIGSTTKHKRGTAPSHIFVRRESPSSEAASNDPGFSCSTAHGSMVPTKTMHSRVGSHS